MLVSLPRFYFSQAMDTPNPMQTKVADISWALADVRRWKILLELAKGEALPVVELARRVGCAPAQASKHMKTLRDAGLVQTGYGRLYSFTPAVRVQREEKLIDLGPCLLRMDAA
jgi:DNA-binding transcriptional ArsR family regulator